MWALWTGSAYNVFEVTIWRVNIVSEVQPFSTFAKAISGSRLESRNVNSVIMTLSVVRSNYGRCHIYVERKYYLWTYDEMFF